MGLAPGILVWSDILRLGEVSRAGVRGGIQITLVHQNAVRCAVVGMIAMVASGRRVDPGERIHKSARTNARLITVQARAVWIRTANAEMSSIRGWRASATNRPLERSKGVLH